MRSKIFPRRPLLSATFVALLFLALPVCAADFSAAPLSGSEVDNWRDKIAGLFTYPSGNSFAIENGASLALTSVAGARPLWLIPVRYDTGSLYTPAVQCALVFGRPQDEASLYAVGTVGTGWLASTACRGLGGIGFTAHPGADMPDIVVFYATHSKDANNVTIVLLAWDMADKRYAVDEAASRMLGDLKEEPTMTNVAAAMARYRGGK